MSITLGELCDLASQASIVVRSKTIAIRELAAVETAAIRKFFPRPMPPMAPDPNKGSLAPLAPNEFDAGYRREYEAWLGTVNLVEMAIAMNWRTKSGAQWSLTASDKENGDWARAAHEEISRLPDGMLIEIVNATVAELDKARQALGKPSAPAARPGS